MDASGVIGRVCVEGTIVACYERRTVTGTRVTAITEKAGVLSEHWLCDLVLLHDVTSMAVRNKGRRRGKG